MKVQSPINVKWLRFCRWAATPITTIKHKEKHPIPKEMTPERVCFTLKGYLHAKQQTRVNGILCGIGFALFGTWAAVESFTYRFFLDNFNAVSFLETKPGSLLMAEGLLFIFAGVLFGRRDASKQVVRRVDLYENLVKLLEQGKSFADLIPESISRSKYPLNEQEAGILGKYARRVGFMC